MKIFLSSLVFVFSSSILATSVHVIPMKSYKELESSPPQIEATFSLSCDQQFIRVIRYEKINTKTGLVSIYVGALVEKSELACQVPAEDIAIKAGVAAGPYYEVLPIGAKN